MRLTLRTLLAYLDDVLEPADAQDIGKKIEESEFAANIVHRTRDVMRRLRLGAPRLSGRGMGLDANTVAEYLDNTLADDRVADFEKVCLESDVHLAEVASCHQVLAIVLGEAAEVSPATRDKMYKLLDRAPAARPKAEDNGHDLPLAAMSTPAPASSGEVSLPPAEPAKRRKVEVPEYLRQTEAERSWRKPAAVAALVALLALVLLMAIDGSWLAERLGLAGARTNSEPVAAVIDEPEPSPEPTQESTEPEVPAAAAAGTSSATTTPTTGGASELQQPESVGRVTPPPTPVPTSPAPTPDPMPLAETATAPVVKPVESAVKPAGTTPAAATPSATPPVATTPAPPTPDPAAPPSSVGRLVSTNEVLLRFDAASGGWQRVPAQEMLSAGQKLLSLPAFRPTITLANGITIELLGGTSAVFERLGNDGVPGISLEYGRMVALTPGRPDARLNISAGGRKLHVVFGDSGSTMALEVRPVRAEGVDPEAGPPPLQVALFVESGRLTLNEADAPQAQEIESPAVVALGSVPVTVEDVPAWISMDRPSPPERIGAEFLADNLTVDRPALLGLKELAEHRRVEVRTLAVKCLARVGDFEPLVAALNQADPNFKTIWNDLIDHLRDAIARGPETAAQVRQAFERQRGESAATLYRMLRGYSLADLRADEGKALKELVAHLDHNDMDHRALAFWNLREMTGATHFYRPDANAEARKSWVQKWKQRLESGQILPPPAEKKDVKEPTGE